MRTGWAANGDLFGGFYASGAANQAQIDMGAGAKSSTLVQDPANVPMLGEADVNPVNADSNPPIASAQGAFSACLISQSSFYNPRWKASSMGVFPTGTNGRLGVHHSGGMNTIWADGHAKWTKNPPEDCHNYISAMPEGLKNIRTAPATDTCRPTGQSNAFCYTQ